MVQHFQSLHHIQLTDSWLTIGVFDGVHLGHQAILRNLSNGAHEAGVPAVVLTFHPHPRLVVGKTKGMYMLTTPEDRAMLMGLMNIDYVITYPFDERTAATSARDFISLLKKNIGFSWLGVGKDFALGKGRQGNVDYLLSLGDEFAFRLQVFTPVKINGTIISSSRIRSHLSVGDIQGATRMLGRPHCLRGIVVRGDSRGRSLGIPTANLEIRKDILIPASGVYACRAEVNGQVYMAAVNIGIRPTFAGDSAHSWVEAHLLDFTGDLYGEEINLEFLAYLRGEQRFSSVEELKQQIALDITKTRKIFLKPL